MGIEYNIKLLKPVLIMFRFEKWLLNLKLADSSVFERYSENYEKPKFIFEPTYISTNAYSTLIFCI